MIKPVWGIVAAAGKARRFGRDKLARRLEGGDTVLVQSCKRLLEGGVERLVIVGDPAEEHGLEQLEEALFAVVPGGEERSDSIRAGLEALPDEVEWVAVHDAARPFVSADLVHAVIKQGQETGAAVPTLECVDTIAEIEGHHLRKPLKRTQLRRVQTPQVMRRDWLAQVVEQAAATDESSVLMALGYPVAAVPGDEENIKVTYARDLAPKAPRKSVTAMGFDVHRYDPDRPLYLGGVHLEGEVGLAGHSDADVLLHALVDALLGGVSEGDIGTHFPPSDERFRDAPSSRFVEHALGLVRARGAVIDHVDLTVIGERPRMSPYRAAIRARLSELLALPIESVSLKATTTEGLGFTGRGEGLAAQAVVSLTLPLTTGA